MGEADFQAQVFRSNAVVLVVFWAPWSKPCQLIDPVLREVEEGCSGRVDVLKIDADENPDLGLWFGIHSVPTLLIFSEGKVVGKIVGTTTSQAILSKLEPFLKQEKQTQSPTLD